MFYFLCVCLQIVGETKRKYTLRWALVQDRPTGLQKLWPSETVENSTGVSHNQTVSCMPYLVMENVDLFPS